MRRVWNDKRILIGAGLFVAAAVFLIFILPRVNPPQPQTHSYYIYPGGVSRALVQDSSAKTQTRRTGLPLYFLPHHLEFESSNGPVEIYVTRIPGNDPAGQVAAMARQTEQLQAGNAPDDVVAGGSGESGRVELHSWPYGTAKYLLLVRAERETEVQVVVKYGP